MQADCDLATMPTFETTARKHAPRVSRERAVQSDKLTRNEETPDGSEPDNRTWQAADSVRDRGLPVDLSSRGC